MGPGTTLSHRIQPSRLTTIIMKLQRPIWPTGESTTTAKVKDNSGTLSTQDTLTLGAETLLISVTRELWSHGAPGTAVMAGLMTIIKTILVPGWSGSFWQGIQNSDNILISIL
jgi:hypothetical protein